jgi:glycosyltransferase involved in cell wall biosynthesis
MVLLRAARRMWMSVPAWESCWRPYALGRSIKFNWLPVASNIPVVDDPAGVRAIRVRYTGREGMLVGHFGTYDKHVADLLLNSVPALMQNGTPQAVLLLGRGSELMRDELIHKRPELADRVYATGTLAAADLSLHVSACDVMLQPYIDGVSSRRTSTMVALAHGVPVVTTSGRLTEPLWAESEAVAIVPVEDMSALVEATQRLLSDAATRRRMSAAAREFYQAHFDVKHIIAKLREDSTALLADVKSPGFTPLGVRCL